MTPIEIIVIICSVLIVGGVIARYIYRKVKKLPTGECACCSKTKRKSNMVEMYYRKYPKNEGNSCCVDRHTNRPL